MLLTRPDVEDLLRIIGDDVRLLSWRKLPKNTGNVVWEIESDHGPFLLKLYGDADEWKVQKELSLHALLRQYGVPTPELVQVVPRSDVIRQPAMLLSWSGIPLADAIRSRLPAAASDNLYWQLGTILRNIHDIPRHRFGYILGGWSPGMYESNEQFMRVEFQTWIERFVNAGGDRELAESINRQVTAHSDAFRHCCRPSLCHNDFHAWNLLVVPGGTRVTAVIDLEWALAGDPLLDLAQVHYTVLQGYPQRECSFYEGYGSFPAGHTEAIGLYLLLRLLQLWIWSLNGEHYHRSDTLLRDIRSVLAGASLTGISA